MNYISKGRNETKWNKFFSSHFSFIDSIRCQRSIYNSNKQQHLFSFLTEKNLKYIPYWYWHIIQFKRYFLSLSLFFFPPRNNFIALINKVWKKSDAHAHKWFMLSVAFTDTLFSFLFLFIRFHFECKKNIRGDEFSTAWKKICFFLINKCEMARSLLINRFWW